MEIIILPLAGLLAGTFLALVSLTIPNLRRFTAAVWIAPFLASMVLLFGGFILADMNPAREYGASYIPDGHEHDPTRLDVALVLLCVFFTFVFSGYSAFRIQKHATKAIRARRSNH
ncbi:hypothetical protein [Acidipila sp. EB88]|uniref:hypothetical protein n=1 Tax=Acidipila sp. EB88 TaxID=2305226 RepID=UPI000F5F30EE|nr:hypothetical protein [Acidipila sp. EB88]RRA49336.1 hypothetical protein D1Y84_14675 [Acidipila sp. EB88]